MKVLLTTITATILMNVPFVGASIESLGSDVCTTPPPASLCLKLSDVRRCKTIQRSDQMRRETVEFSNGTRAVMQSGGCENSYKRITFVLDESLGSANDRWQAVAERLAKNDYQPVFGRRVVGAMKRIARRGHNKPVYDLIFGYEQLMVTEQTVRGKVHLTLTNNVEL